MSSLVQALGKEDAQELADYLVARLCSAKTGDELLMDYAARHAKEVLVGGAKPNAVLKKGRPSREALIRLITRDSRQLASFIDVLMCASASADSPEPSEATEQSIAAIKHLMPWTAENLTKFRDDNDAESAFVIFIGTAEPYDKELLALVGGWALDAFRSSFIADCEETQNAADVEPGVVAEYKGRIEKLEGELRSANCDLKLARRAYQQLDLEFQKKTDAERRQGKTMTRLKTEIEELKAAIGQSASESEQSRARITELTSATKRTGTLAENQIMQLRSEAARLEEQLCEARSELQNREAAIGRANVMVDALEDDRARLQHQLSIAATEREELVSLSDIFADQDPEASLHQLDAAMTTLASLKTIVDRSVAAKRRMELGVEATRAREEAELELAMDEVERRHQSDEAWATRERDRISSDLARWKEVVFADGEPSHLLVDGHNLILRRYEANMERTSRVWLEEMVCSMNAELDLDIRLVFDGPDILPSSEDVICNGVHRYFHSDAEGGADARIASLIREFPPTDKTLVASSDRRHVWTDALCAQDEGYDVSCVSAEDLHNYLIALDDRQRAEIPVMV